MTDQITERMHDMMFASFHALPKTEQLRKIILAGNAEFFLRMMDGFDTATVVGKTVTHIREALTRYLPDMKQTEPTS